MPLPSGNLPLKALEKYSERSQISFLWTEKVFRFGPTWMVTISVPNALFYIRFRRTYVTRLHFQRRVTAETKSRNDWNLLRVEMEGLWGSHAGEFGGLDALRRLG